jgi:hypothetical protein
MNDASSGRKSSAYNPHTRCGLIGEKSDNLVNAVGCCQLHLYDVDIPGGITFKESDDITPGDLGFCVVDTGEYL